MARDPSGDVPVLRDKRSATQYQILVQIARNQPAVSQQEIADAVGVTSQAVSNYVQELVEREHVRKQGRGRYEVTKEGVDWLITQTESLREFVDDVSENVLEEVEVETAIATESIEENDRVSLSMIDGILHATPGNAGAATAVAVTEAAAGHDVGVADFEGVLDYEYGTVTVVSVPRIRDGGSSAVDLDAIARETDDHDLLAVAGTEAIAGVRRSDLAPDVRFGARSAVREAATRGLDVLLVVTTDRLSAHTDALRESNVNYEVIEGAD